jgi:hypothetical protein
MRSAFKASEVFSSPGILDSINTAVKVAEENKGLLGASLNFANETYGMNSVPLLRKV